MKLKNLLSLCLVVVSAAAQDKLPTQAQVDQILVELRAIRQLLQEQRIGKPSQETITRLKVPVGDAPAMGSTDAPLTLVEFTDYQCPFCQRFYLTTFPLLKKDFIDTGKVRFVSRDLPLTQIHPYAAQAAQAAHCAGAQGKFWEYRDRLQRNNTVLDLPSLEAHATSLKLDGAAFHSCLGDEKTKDAVELDGRSATDSGVIATPSFVLGKSDGKEVDGELISGALPYELFSSKLKGLLQNASPSGNR